jgi:peptidoglycan/LPS O-acetylase OafA/YrhL
MRDGYMPCLDGLRALALLFVFGMHGGWRYAAGGAAGVDMFFVLSGFLITRTLNRDYLRPPVSDLRRFYCNRFLRLFPAMFAMCVGFTIYVIVCFHSWKMVLDDVIPALTYISDYTRSRFHRPGALGHQWSLSVEEQFYLVWPVLLLLMRKGGLTNRRITLVLAFGVAVVCVWRAWLFARGANIARIYDGIDCHSDGLMIGCILGLMRRDLLETFGRLWPVGLLVLLEWLVFGHGGSAMLYMGWFLVIAFSAGTLVAHATAARPAPLYRALFASWPARWIGRHSYGMYLWHFPLLGMFRHFGFSWHSAMNMAGPISAVAAGLSYALMERPLMAHRHELSDSFKLVLSAAGPALLAIGIGYAVYLQVDGVG